MPVESTDPAGIGVWLLDNLTQPAATVLASAGIIVAAVITFFIGYLSRRQLDRHHKATHTLAATQALRDRFTTITGQLADPAPAIRTAAVSALEALADDWLERKKPRETQACINVLCDYLRTPYEPPARNPHLRRETRRTHRTKFDYTDTTHEYPHDDLDTRHAITRTIAAHLQPDHDHSWSTFDYDLTGAYLHNTDFTGATFSGQVTSFAGATFSGGGTWFGGATFSGEKTFFYKATFSSMDTWFDDATFSGGDHSFAGATFSGERTSFDGAAFSGSEVTSFEKATFRSKVTSFARVTFNDENTSFDEATFSGEKTFFYKATFSGESTSFDEATFNSSELAWFNEAAFNSSEGTSFIGATFSGESAMFVEATFSSKVASFKRATFGSKVTWFRDVAFSSSEGTSFIGATFDGKVTMFENPQAWVKVWVDWERHPHSVFGPLRSHPVSVLPYEWPPVPKP
ncbi:pentapeptide repeat-containing protein [Rhodococcus sp. 14-2496-1d]|uniref:pentapeptide repeat-containing protein n=1 Tax=Rhodococcus sp. 14-2496-1d TaxID=2023146 RepID=UPI0015C662C4|nr:pentapeptide repeat-containing protein [Rhodococcus sp. 14-2496-1d]